MADFYVNRRGVSKGLSFKFSVLSGGSVPAWNLAKPPGLAALTAAGAGPGRLSQ